MIGGLILVVATSTGGAELPVLVPIVTSTETTVTTRRDVIARHLPPIVPIITSTGTTFAEPDAAPQPERHPVYGDAGAPPDPTAPPVFVERPEPEPSPVGPGFSFNVRTEMGLFDPVEISRMLGAATPTRGSPYALLIGLGIAGEWRPVSLLGVGVSAIYLLGPAESGVAEAKLIHGVEASGGATVYVPAGPILDVTMGAEGALLWIGNGSAGAPAPGFVWRVGARLHEPGLPVTVLSLFFRRAAADVDGVEVSLSGMGVKLDVILDL